MVSVLATNHNPLVNQQITFRLSTSFLALYRDRTPPFGFNGLGELVYMRTYSRLKSDGTNEQWWETVQRVVEGTYSMQKRWILAHHLGWDSAHAQQSAQEMYDRMWNMKFLPPGRGLWAMGSPLTEERGLFAALNNCAFVSTENLAADFAAPFLFLMEASMLGIGVGFDTKGAGQVTITPPHEGEIAYTIPDTREGWVESVRLVLNAYLLGHSLPALDYSLVRPAGMPIKGFGGVSAGPEPLRELHETIGAILAPCIGQPMSSTNIVDIMNLIGKCVVAGNVRRTAEIAFGDTTDDAYLDLKNYEKHPHRAEYGWTSNNSIFAQVGMAYEPACERVARNGEPGFAWLENMRAYGRMDDRPNHKDKRAKGGNPCLEQTLESYELCCLVETFPTRHESLEDFQRTLKFAYLYAKTVTLGPTPWEKTNRVMMRNRRIGCSQSGVVQAIAKLGVEEYRKWCEAGYQTIQDWDKVYSEWLAVPRSIKTTSIKPSGTVSLLAGATPGMHFPEARTYIRRMRISKYSDMVKPLRAAGYLIEPAYGSEDTTLVVTVPVKIVEPVRTVSEVSMWEQLALAAFLQRYWADNQVSCTVSFDPAEGVQIAHALNYYQYQLKGVSFLPRLPEGAYAQMPYEAISEQTYTHLVAQLKPFRLGPVAHEEADVERFCDGATCVLPMAA